MKLLVAIEAVGWEDRVVGRAEQFRRTRFAQMLKDIADRIQNGGTEGTFERPDVVAKFRLELATDKPTADAA
jgi:hypothetical protein